MSAAGYCRVVVLLFTADSPRIQHITLSLHELSMCLDFFMLSAPIMDMVLLIARRNVLDSPA